MFGSVATEAAVFDTGRGLTMAGDGVGAAALAGSEDGGGAKAVKFTVSGLTPAG